MSDTMEHIFGTAGILAQHLPGHEVRLGQRQMAEAVAALLARQDGPPAASLIVEAETGLGKTLAYLIPAARSGRRVVVSTNTRNLQDQILRSEIPFIIKHIAPELKAMCVKGRQNYLCLYRWHQLAASHQQELFAANKEDLSKANIRAWLKKTTFADRSELPAISGSSPLWQSICCQSHFCLGSDCPDHSRCYLNRVRREAAACQLLVVNHHLLFSDLAVRRSGYGEVLPRYESVIFDEAHHLEEIAAQFFGYSFSRYQLLDFLSDVEKTARDSGGKRKQKKMFAAVESLSGLGERFFSLFPPAKGRFPLLELFTAQPFLAPAKDALLAALDALAEQIEQAGEQEDGGQWKPHLLRCEGLTDALRRITTAGDSSHVRWFERSEKNLSVAATPIAVATDLQNTLYAQVRHCVFTSATLRADAAFSYFRQRLGIAEESQTCVFPSPFDYKNRTLLYVPDQSFPEPNAPGHRERLHQEISALINYSRGRALVLFTSVQAMESAWQSLRNEISYPLLRQGTASRQHLLDRFSKEIDSVLFAVASFWEGVDVPGESLSLVIIDKLPFEVPTDPVLLARIERIKAAGGNPFVELQVPRAVLSLRQGVGRLMRRASDRGVAAVLDVRLFTKPYGSKFLAALPPSPLTRKLKDVERFFSR
jgi:ATP-dependent DNA helicase DinG